MASPRTPQNPRDGQPKRPDDKGKRPRLSLGTFYLFVLIALLLLAVQTFLAGGGASAEVDYSAFLEQLEGGDVESFEVQDHVDIRGHLHRGGRRGRAASRPPRPSPRSAEPPPPTPAGSSARPSPTTTT